MDPLQVKECIPIERLSLLEIPQSNGKIEPVTRTWYIPKRFIVTLLLFLGTTSSCIMRTNLSIAILEMTSNKTFENGTLIRKAEFQWNPQQKGIVLSLGSYGALLAPFGGLFSHRFGGATIYGVAHVVMAILTLLSPYLLRLDVLAYAIIRMLEGVLEALSAPAFIEILVRWAPPHERSRMVLIAHVGLYLGIVINYQLSGYLAYRYGWESVFYISGLIALTWFVFWIILVRNQPSDDRLISKAEKNYLKQVIPDRRSEKKISNYPYKKILMSGPAWAYINEYFSWGWAHSFFLYGLPMYVKDTYKTNLHKVGIISSIPLMCAVIGLIAAPCLADYLRSKKILRIPTVHRLFIGIGQLSAIIFLLLIGLWADFTESIICFSLLRFWCSFTETSNSVLPIDMFSGYASFVKGLAITAGCISNALNPTIMGFIVSDGSRSRWNVYFLFISIFNIWSTLIFYLFGSGERQPWAMPENNENSKTANNSVLKEQIMEQNDLDK